MDWTIFARYAAPVIALFVGAGLNRFLERRSKLISYLGHASAVPITPPQGQAFQVHTHSVVVRNGGKHAANNVRLGHHYLPASFSVYPSVDYRVADLPGGGKEIVFPSLVPGEQVTVAYLYYPPLLFTEINSYTKSDDGFAKIVNLLPTPQWSPWLARLAWALILVGAITVLAGLGQLVVFVWRFAYHGA